MLRPTRKADNSQVKTEEAAIPVATRLWRRFGDRDVTSHGLGLLALRSATMGAKFALTLFITKYMGLADLGTYGIVTSLTALAPVLLGFGVSNHLGREATREGPAGVCTRLVQYFFFVVQTYAALLALAMLAFPDHARALALLCGVLILEHLQTDLLLVMALTDRAYAAQVVNFVRSAGWMLVYAPLALSDPKLRTLEALGVFWLAGLVVATILTVAVTRHWRWAAALRAAPRGRPPLPHRHGSTALYLNDVANTAFQYVDRYVVGIFLSPAALGVYVLFWSITNALNNLIATALVPTRRRLLQVNDASPMEFDGELRRVTLAATLMTVVLGLLAVGFVYIVAPLLGRPEIIPHLPLMFLLCAALVARTIYEALGIAFYARRRDDLTLYSGVIILVLSLGLNLGLDPYFGIAGASVVLLASYSVGIVARQVIISRGFKPHAGAAATVQAMAAGPGLRAGRRSVVMPKPGPPVAQDRP